MNTIPVTTSYASLLSPCSPSLAAGSGTVAHLVALTPAAELAAATRRAQCTHAYCAFPPLGC
jgi:hypothetical protein